MASAPKHTAGIAANRPRTDQQYGVRFVGFYNPRLDPRGKYVMSAPYTRFEMFCAEAALGHFQKYEKTDNTPSEGEQGAYARFRGWHHHSTRLLCESMNNFFTATKLWTTNAHIRSNEPTYDPKTFVASWDPQPINQFQEMTDHSPVLPGPAYEDRHAETQLWNKYQGFDHNQAANLMEAADVSFKAWSSRWQGKGKARKDVLAYYRKLNFFNERLPVLSPYRSPSFSAVAECRESDLDQLREIYLPFLQAMERYPFGGDAVDQQVWFQLFEDEIPDFTPIDHHMDIDTQWGSLEDMVLYMHEQGEDDYTAPDVSIMEKYGFAGSRDLYCASFILAWNGNTAAFVAATNPDSTTEAKHPTRLLVNMTDVCAGEGISSSFETSQR